ncbi:MAG: Efflux ABC transporter, permease protein, partial [uncultured Thermomicrobiales bacterium]
DCPFRRRRRLGDDAAPQPPAHAALPLDDPAARRHTGRHPAPVRLRLRRHARRRARRPGGRPRRVRRLRHARHPHDDRGGRRPGDGDFGRDGHDQGHHRPVPDDGHLPRLGPDRPRPRQSDPGGSQHGGRARRGAADRIPAQRRRRRMGRGDRPPRDGRARAHLAGGRARPGVRERRDRQQPPPAPRVPALLRQRVRAHRVDADRAALVRRVPALHPRHRDPAGPAAGHADRQQRDPRRRLVRRHRPGRLRLGDGALQPRAKGV